MAQSVIRIVFNNITPTILQRMNENMEWKKKWRTLDSVQAHVWIKLLFDG